MISHPFNPDLMKKPTPLIDLLQYMLPELILTVNVNITNNVNINNNDNTLRL